MDEETDVLGLLREIQETDRAFFAIIRFMDGHARSRAINLYLQNTTMALSIVREYQRNARNITRMTVTLPAFDLSGNFFDPVAVRPTQEQITHGTERNVSIADMTCSICQESVTSATRIRRCGHCFHEACISQWFTMNPRCPMCRADVRGIDTFDSLLRALNEHPTNEGHRVHTDEES
jgi:hypothetical protein